MNINNFTNNLYVMHENLDKYSSRYGYDYLADLCQEEQYDLIEELFGITQEDLGELYYFDSVGKNTGLLYDNNGIGKIDIDREYDTTIVKYLKDCYDDELHLIYKHCKHYEIDDDVYLYVLHALDIED